ncbi:AAA family ATPase [Streptomyces sp. NPDC005302]|uniref:AAA family ATPase n=1 Tax=Streptomyces sp. NPDC005302 TaxID=3154675 RepID=UPI0033B2ACD8
MNARTRVTDALNNRGCRGRGNSWQCPAHEDRTPSLSIGNRNDGNGIVLSCHTGCDIDDIVAALGLTLGDLFDEPLPKPDPNPTRRKVADYPYVDEQGELLLRVERWEPGKNGKKKDFLQRTPDGGYKTKGVRRVLYRLPEVVATAQAGGIVLVCEGEKDADNLAKIGATATTMPGGVGMGWRDDYTASLRGAAEVVIIADRDDAGITHARKVAASLARFGVPHRIALPAVAHAKADVSDHLAAGYGFDDLIPLADSDDEEPEEPAQEEAPTPEPEPEPEQPQDRFPSINWYEAYATDFTRIDWLPGRFMERGQQVALVGPGKAGKSIFVQYWIFCAITGRSFLGDERREPLNVLYFDRENNLRDIVTRMIAFGATPDDLQRLDYRLFPRFSGSFDQSSVAAAELLAIVEERPRDLVIFDTVSRFITGKENDADTWLQFYGRVHAPLKARTISGVRLDHMGKDEDRGARGNSAKSQDVDHVWELTRLTENKSFDPSAGIEHITTTLKLNRTHTRSGLGEDLFLITRRGQRQRGGLWVPGGTRHELSSNTGGGSGAAPGSAAWIVELLDSAKVPNDWGARRVIPKCQELGIKAAKTKIEEAIRIRKNRPASDVPPHVPYSSVTETSPEENGQQDIFPGQTSPGDPWGTPRNTQQRGTSPRPPTKEGGRPQGGHVCTVCNLTLDSNWASRGYDTHIGCDTATGSHPPAA